MKFEAASAIGNIASRDQSLIATLQDKIRRNKESYMYMYSIKEALCFATKL